MSHWPFTVRGLNDWNDVMISFSECFRRPLLITPRSDIPDSPTRYRGGHPEDEALAIHLVGRSDRPSFIGDFGVLHADLDNPAPYQTVNVAGGLQVVCVKTGELTLFDGTATVLPLSTVIDKSMKAPGVFQGGPIPVGEAFATGWEKTLHPSL